MSFLESRQQAAATERRRSARFTIDIPAILRTVTGDRPCRMANISDNGAKLEADNVPKEGVTGWLVLGDQEIFCKVIWTSDTACGIQFERCLGANRLMAIAGSRVKQAGPVANAGNIQMGRKRSGLLVSAHPSGSGIISRRQVASSSSA